MGKNVRRVADYEQYKQYNNIMLRHLYRMAPGK